MARAIDLAKIFSAASKVLAKNQDALNQSDGHNHNHGDHMVEVFDVITRAMKEKKDASSADQLEYAARLLRQKTNSGSGQAYASGLERAARALVGRSLTKENAGALIPSLLGARPQVAPQSDDAGDLPGSLFASLPGRPPGGKGADRPGIDELLNAGLYRKDAKQTGRADWKALIGAVVNSSAIGEGGRAESGALVADALLAALSKAK
jgi:hypothetical protein